MSDKIDEKIAKIDESIRKIDAEISQFKEMKSQLLAAKEQLKCKKFNQRQKELQNNDWSDGKSVLHKQFNMSTHRFYSQQNPSLGANKFVKISRISSESKSFAVNSWRQSMQR